MRKLYYSLIKRLNLVVRNEYSVVTRNGVRFLLNKHNWIDNRLLCFRPYEKANLAAMLQLIEQKQIDYFFDIGANIGYYTVLLASKTRLRHVYAYEPMKRNFYQLGANILINNLSDKVSCYNMALGNETKVMELWYNAGSTGIATLDRTMAGRADKDYSICETVHCNRFDDTQTMENQTVLVKIDVEGFEQQVLAGMERFLAQNRVYVCIEINRDADHTLKLLQENGFQVLSLESNDYILSNMQ